MYHVRDRAARPGDFHGGPLGDLRRTGGGLGASKDGREMR